VFLLSKSSEHVGFPDSAARLHAYDASIKLPFATNSEQNYRIRLQEQVAEFFCN
jgi:hypothetical protein